MARSQLTIDLASKTTGLPVVGATATVKKVDGTNATLYAGRTGGTTATNPITTDALGMGQVWLERGLYRIVWAGGVTRPDEWVESSPSDDAEIDVLWLKPGTSASPLVISTAAELAALTPADGDEVYFVADATLGIIWRFRYRAASASAYKWEFVGGSPLAAEVTTPESRANAAFGDLSTIGPSITVPLAGDYEVALAAQLQTAADSAAPRLAYMSYAIGGTAAVDADALKYDASFYNAYWQVHGQSDYRPRRKAAIAAATALVAKYRSDGASSTFRDRLIRVLPCRVG